MPVDYPIHTHYFQFHAKLFDDKPSQPHIQFAMVKTSTILHANHWHGDYQMYFM